MLKSSDKILLKSFQEKEIDIDFNKNQNIYCLLKINKKKCKLECTSSCCCFTKILKINLCYKDIYKNFTFIFINLISGLKYKYELISNYNFKIAQLPEGEYLVILSSNGKEYLKFNIIFSKKYNFYKFEVEV